MEDRVELKDFFGDDISHFFFALNKSGRANVPNAESSMIEIANLCAR